MRFPTLHLASHDVNQMMEWDEDAREATLAERKWAARCRYNARYEEV